jgi:hypothetical protein
MISDSHDKSPTIIECSSPSSIDKVSFNLSRSRPLSISFAPARAQPTAIPLPIPDDAPVTNTVLPSRENARLMVS